MRPRAGVAAVVSGTRVRGVAGRYPLVESSSVG